MGEIKYQGRKKTRHGRLSVMFFPTAFVRYVPLPDVKYPSIYKVSFGFNSADSPCDDAHDETLPISQSVIRCPRSRKFFSLIVTNAKTSNIHLALVVFRVFNLNALICWSP